MATTRIAFMASTAPAASEALRVLTARYGQVALQKADVVVALGGDGFMLQTLHETQAMSLPVYGMNCGTIGFLMNTYQPGESARAAGGGGGGGDQPVADAGRGGGWDAA